MANFQKSVNLLVKARATSIHDKAGTIYEKAGPKTWAKRKFTEQQVREIRAGGSAKAWAEKLGVSVQCIYQIKHGITYSWIID